MNGINHSPIVNSKCTTSSIPELRIKIIPAPELLKEEIECFRITEYNGEEEIAINVSLNGRPGIVFQHHQRRSAINKIITQSGRSFKGEVPTLFVYGQNTERSVMNQTKGPFTMTQVILRPQALRTLLGLNASELTHRLVGLGEFSTVDLDSQLFEAENEQKRIDLLSNYLLTSQKSVNAGEEIVKESLRLIQDKIHSISVRYLLEYLGISERQFERRFTQAVGISPQFYIRIKRYIEAISLMKTGQFVRLTDIAHALNFYDQSHFIRDIKEFSGISPKDISQMVDGFHDQGGYFQIKT